jgi:uncharacterized SAM-binding protein YcdF (DUF218 family)
MDFLRNLLNPIWLLLVVLATLLYRRRGMGRPPWWWAACVGVALLYLTSTRTVVRWTMARLEIGCPTAVLDAPVDAVLVLGGGLGPVNTRREPELAVDTAARLLAGVRVFRYAGAAKLIVSGGPTARGLEPEAATMARQAVSLGVPPEAVVQESRSFNTWQQADRLRDAPAMAGHVALVTSAMHMRRAMYAFAGSRARLTPVSVGCVDAPDAPRRILTGLMPAPEALLSANNVVYEVTGLAWYRLRRWWRGY